MCTQMFKAFSSYLQGTICNETPPLMQVEEMDTRIVTMPKGYTNGQGINFGGQYGLLDENGDVCAVSRDWRSLV